MVQSTEIQSEVMRLGSMMNEWLKDVSESGFLEQEEVDELERYIATGLQDISETLRKIMYTEEVMVQRRINWEAAEERAREEEAMAAEEAIAAAEAEARAEAEEAEREATELAYLQYKEREADEER